MQLEQERKLNALVLYPYGRIDSNVAKEFEEQFFQLLSAGEKKVVLDCNHLDYISSAGLRILLMAAKQLKLGFWITNLKPNIVEVLEVSGFATILNIKTTQEEALQSI
jgi:anti-sigma B factor antagonist